MRRGKILLHPRDIREHRSFFEKVQMGFDKGKGRLGRRTENDDICFFQVFFLDGIHQMKIFRRLCHGLRAVQPDHVAPEGMEAMGKRAAHEPQADDGDGLIGKVMIAVHNRYPFTYICIYYIMAAL